MKSKTTSPTIDIKVPEEDRELVLKKLENEIKRLEAIMKDKSNNKNIKQ